MKLFKRKIKPVVIDLNNIFIKNLCSDKWKFSVTIYGDVRSKIPKRLKRHLYIDKWVNENLTYISGQVEDFNLYTFAKRINKILKRL